MNSTLRAAVRSITGRTSTTATTSSQRCYSKGSKVCKEAYKSPEYPWATSPPVVTKHSQNHASGSQETGGFFSNLFGGGNKQQQQPAKDSSNSSTTTSTTPFEPSEQLKATIQQSNDPFDDTNQFSQAEQQDIRLAQKQHLSTTTHLTPITTDLPPFFAATSTARSNQNTASTVVEDNDNDATTPRVTTLDNGVRIITKDTFGPVTTYGLAVNLGSRYDTIPGTTNLLEGLFFSGTQDKTSETVHHDIVQWGGSHMGITTREQSLFWVELLRPNVRPSLELFAQLILEPRYDNLVDIQNNIQFLNLPEYVNPELLLSEAMQEAAFGSDSQLGQPHACPPDSLPHISTATLLEHWQQNVLNNPRGMVLAAVGMEHEPFVEWANTHFGHLTQCEQQLHKMTPSLYVGGESRRTLELPPDFDSSAPLSETDVERQYTRVSVCLPIGGWHEEDDLVTACVLQSLLGGGSSFSAGGPGKGMYSRLYRTVLNSFRWAEKAEAFTSFHEEVGLFGIAGASQPQHARDLVKLFCQHLLHLSRKPVHEDELERAKNMLKCNVLMQLESRLVLFEDLSRQLLTYNRHETMRETAARIESVTAEDCQDLVNRSLSHYPPSLASVGTDLSKVPRADEIKEWFQ